MKILFYIDSMNPAGGIERVVSKHISFLSENHEIILLTKDNPTCFYPLPNNIERQSIHLPVLTMKSSRIKRSIHVLRQLIEVKKNLRSAVDNNQIIYCTHVRNLLELYLAGANPNKIILTEHGSYFGYNLLYKVLKKFLYKKCKYIISPTKLDYKIYKKKKYNVKYIPNPLSFYNHSSSTLKTKKALTIGRLTKDKRQYLLLEIWKEIIKKNPDWKLIIVGQGEEELSLKRKILEYQIYNSVDIIPPTKNIEELYLESSVFLLTSKYEGFGMVLAEAMSCGVPCVTFDCPSGPKDIVQNNITGYLVPNGNKQKFIRSTINIMNNEKLRVSMGKASKTHITYILDEKIKPMWENLLEGKQ